MTRHGHGMVKEAAKYVCRQLRNPRVAMLQSQYDFPNNFTLLASRT